MSLPNLAVGVGRCNVALPITGYADPPLPNRPRRDGAVQCRGSYPRLNSPAPAPTGERRSLRKDLTGSQNLSGPSRWILLIKKVALTGFLLYYFNV